MAPNGSSNEISTGVLVREIDEALTELKQGAASADVCGQHNQLARALSVMLQIERQRLTAPPVVVAAKQPTIRVAGIPISGQGAGTVAVAIGVAYLLLKTHGLLP